MKTQFYTFPESQFTITLAHLLTVGKFGTYTDSDKRVAVEKHMVKMNLKCKNGHPYSQVITKKENDDFHIFAEQNGLLA